MEEGVITLTMKEQARYEVIKESLKKRIRVKEASIMLGISVRQVYRIRKRVKEEGIKGRTVYPDNTISYKGIKYQTLPDAYRASYARAKVEVLKHLDGKISIIYKGRKLKYRKIGSYKDSEGECSLEEKLLQGDISILQ